MENWKLRAVAFFGAVLALSAVAVAEPVPSTPSVQTEECALQSLVLTPEPVQSVDTDTDTTPVPGPLQSCIGDCVGACRADGNPAQFCVRYCRWECGCNFC